MTDDVRELLPLYALGVLDVEEMRIVEHAIAGDAALAAELDACQETADALSESIGPVTPSPDVKHRLLASVGGGRFESFSARLALLFDLTVDRARELLGLIERPASWVAQVPGISLIHFDGGPAMAAADCGFVRLGRGMVFPVHTHLGEETVIVLSGRVQNPTDGREVGPGDAYISAEGTSHHIVCVGDEDCIYALRAVNGVSFGGRGRRARLVKR
jgi:Cupin domain